MKLVKKAGAVSEIWQIWIADSSSAVGAGLTGLVFNSAGLTAYFHRDVDTTATVISLVTMTVGTFTSSGFKEIDATNMPGWYQFCPPNAAIAAGAKSSAFLLKGATNMAPLAIETQLSAVDVDDATAMGVARIDALISSRMATFTLPANFSAMSISAGGLVDILQTAADKVWATATRAITDKNGFQLSAAGVQAIWDALTTALTTVGSIGKRLADNIDATISSRSTYAGGAVASVTAGVTVTTNNDKAGYALSAAGNTGAADALLNRNIAGGSSAGRLVMDALRFIRNRKAIAAGTLTVYQEDDSTSAWTAAVTTTAGNPISEVDPA